MEVEIKRDYYLRQMNIQSAYLLETEEKTEQELRPLLKNSRILFCYNGNLINICGNALLGSSPSDAG